MAKSQGQTHQTNGWHLSYSWLGTGIFLWRKCWIKPGFKASLSSHLFDSGIKFYYIDNDVWA